jgi:hypothetical protein
LAISRQSAAFRYGQTHQLRRCAAGSIQVQTVALELHHIWLHALSHDAFTGEDLHVDDGA